MIRLIYAAGALAASTAVLMGAGGPASPQPDEKPAAASTGKPVFLGRVVVTARPLGPGEEP